MQKDLMDNGLPVFKGWSAVRTGLKAALAGQTSKMNDPRLKSAWKIT